MDTWMNIAIGLVLLVVGGELLVRGAVASAKALGVSPLLIGLTLVGFGTSTPELVTSLTAALNGSAGIAVGNVVGSNIANILFILGLSSVIYPMAVNPKGFKRDALMVSFAALTCLAVVLYGLMGMALGLLFVASLLAYIVFVYVQERQSPDEAAVVAALGMSYVNIPVAGAGDLTPANVALLAAALDGHGDSQRTLLHCASSNRVGAMLALKAKQVDGKSAAEALAIGRAAGLAGLEPVVVQLLQA